jgi:RecA/RadA recombinase
MSLIEIHEKVRERTTLERLTLSLSLQVEDVRVVGQKYTGKVSGDGGRTIAPSINVETGEWSCSCEDFIARKNIMCKHVLALLRYIKSTSQPAFDTFIKNLDGKPPSVETASVPSGISALDECIEGIPKGVVLGIAGRPQIGKTFLSFHFAYYAYLASARPGLFINTETDFPIKKIKFQDIYAQRLKVPKDAVEIINMTTLAELGTLFGIRIELEASGKKVTPYLSYVGGERDFPAYILAREKKLSVMVVDSLTAPLKREISVPPNQNLPARASVINFLWARMERIAYDLNIPVIITHHLSVNPEGYGHGLPWGGDSILYHTKFFMFLLDGAKEERDKWGEEGRRIMLFRYPGIQSKTVIIPVRLKKDFGFCEDNIKEAK